MNNIEQEFFEAFGVEKGMYCYYCNDRFNCFKQKCRNPLYPTITPEIILELMQIIFDATLKKYPKTTGLNFDIKRDIKEQILSGCIQLQPEIQDQVKGLLNGK